MGVENRAHTSHRIKKADTFVNRDEVVSKNCSETPVNALEQLAFGSDGRKELLRGTTRIESY